MKTRGVPALGNLDEDRIGAATGKIVVLERATDAPSLHADDGIGGRVEAVSVAEDRGGNPLLRQSGPVALEGFTDDEAEKLAGPLTGVEVGAFEDTFELTDHFLLTWRPLRTHKMSPFEYVTVLQDGEWVKAG